MKLDLNLLITAYINEKATTKILPYKSIVDDFIFHIKFKCDADIKPINTDLNELREIEINRIKYFIKGYLHCRLDKIRTNIFINDSFLNLKEKIFRSKYLMLLEDYNLPIDESKSTSDVEFVGFIVNKNTEKVILDGEIIDLIIGDFYISNIDDIFDKLLSNVISLV